MTVNKENTKVVSNWAKNHGWPNCPICDNDHWLVSEMVSMEPAVTDPIKPSHPISAIPLTCTHCTYMMFLSAAALGLAPREAI
jgi:hypothetical protein